MKKFFYIFKMISWKTKRITLILSQISPYHGLKDKNTVPVLNPLQSGKQTSNTQPKTSFFHLEHCDITALHFLKNDTDFLSDLSEAHDLKGVQFEPFQQKWILIPYGCNDIGFSAS